MNGEQRNKMLALLKSRKFWSMLVGLLVSIGLITLSEAQESELVGSVLAIVNLAVYQFSVAYEDGKHAVAEATKEVARAEAQVEIATLQNTAALEQATAQMVAFQNAPLASA